MGKEPSRGTGNNGRTRGHDIDAEADALLHNIESQTGSMYAVHAGEDAEEFDPSNLHADDLAQDGDIAADLAHSLSIDEPVEGLDRDPLEPHAAGSPATESAREEGAAQETPVRQHRGLKRALAIVIVVLVLIICAIGVLIWHNSISPDVGQTDTEALVTSQAGTNQVAFEKVDSDRVPELASTFSLKAKAAQKKLGTRFQTSGSASKSRDKRIKSMRKILEGSYLDKDGKISASVGLGLDKKNRVVYAYVLYNLDTIEVAESNFSELVKSDVVASSVLSGMGADVDELGSPQLEMDDASRETAEFSGKTGAKKPPKTWAISETYAYAADNATTRTLLAELW